MQYKFRIGLVMLCVSVKSIDAVAGVITFEQTPGGSTPTDDAALTAPYLLDGGGTVRFFFDVNGNNAFDSGADAIPVFEAAGPDTLNGFQNDVLNVNDRANAGYEGQLGSFFLRQPQSFNQLPGPFFIDYDTSQTINALSGEIWDVDGDAQSTERWVVDVLNGSNAILATVTSPLGADLTLNGLPWVFSFSNLPAGVDKLRIRFTGSKTSFIGIAFNNFSPTFAAVPEPTAPLHFIFGFVLVVILQRPRSA